jgi:hypothetical protein
MNVSKKWILKYFYLTILLNLILLNNGFGQTSPTLSSPVSNTSFSSQITISLTIPQTYQTGTAKITFINTAGTYSNTLILTDNISSLTFTTTTNNIISNSNNKIISATSSTLPDDTYSVSLVYKDINSTQSTPATSSNVLIQTSTPSPILTSPTTGTVFSSTSTPTFAYTLPSPPLSGSVLLVLSPGSYVYSLPNTSGNNSYSITSNIPPNGTYTSTISYKDFLGNPVATSSAAVITFDRSTQNPTITSPLTNSINTGTVTVTYTTPEIISPGSKRLYISENGSIITRITLKDNDNGSINLNFKDLSSSANQYVSIAGTTNINDGTYSLTVSYQDQYGNPESGSTINFTIDSQTIPIQISSPSPNTIVTNNLNLSFRIPETILSGSITLNLKSETNTITYHLSDLAVNNYNWNINPNVNILTSNPTYFTSVSPSSTTNIPAGTYSLTMYYNDILGNPTSGMIMPGIRFKPATLTPKIKSPETNSFISSYFLYQDSLPESNLPGSKKIQISKNNILVTTIVLNNNISDSIYFNIHHLSEASAKISAITGADSLADGTYTVQLSYQDIYNNPAATITSTININSIPFIGVLSHTNNIVFGTFTETLTFNKPVSIISNNPIMPNIINNSPSASIGSLVANSDKTVYTFNVTPLQQGMIKLQAPYEGVARDLYGNNSQVIAIDSIEYKDTTLNISPTITGNVSFCIGDSVMLTSSSAKSYLWTNGATTKSIVVKQAGTFNVKVIYDNNTTGTSNNVIITAYSIPAKPTISRDGSNKLVSSATNGNNWYESGLNLNDTSLSYKPSHAGLYAVRTIQSGCASVLSNDYYYFITDIVNLGANEFIKLAPNPFTTQLNIDFSIKGYQKINLEIFELSSGTKVATMENVLAGSTIYTSSFASGTYFIKISSRDNQINQQFKMIKL